MPKKPHIDKNDKDAFQAAMRGVKRLQQSNKADFSPPPIVKKQRVRPPLSEEDVPSLPLSDHENLQPVGSEDTLLFSRPGLQHKILRKLRGGQYNVDAILDLHRKTVEEAREALSHFLLACQKKQICHVLIIHGKGHGSGRPILKNKLNHWLRQTEHVLAFCSATAKDGRSGAVYVLLRR